MECAGRHALPEYIIVQCNAALVRGQHRCCGYVVAFLQATKLSQEEYVAKIDAEEMTTLVAVDYNPNKHRHIAYKPQDVMNWVLQSWYKEMLSMNHLLVRVHICPYRFPFNTSAEIH